jgi:hypothetical protein
MAYGVGVSTTICGRTYGEHAACRVTYDGDLLISEGLQPHEFAFCPGVPECNFGWYRFTSVPRFEDKSE